MPRLTFANVVSCIALFVALGGTGYAALRLPRDSVTSRELRAGAVGSSEVRDGTIRVQDLYCPRVSGTPPRTCLASLEQGPAGPPGVQGPSGPPGPAGLAGVIVVVGKSAVDSNASKTATARCPEGKVALSGYPGIELPGAIAPVGLVGWGPTRGPAFGDPGTASPDGWYVEGHEESPTDEAWGVSIVLTCATAG